MYSLYIQIQRCLATMLILLLLYGASVDFGLFPMCGISKNTTTVNSFITQKDIRHSSAAKTVDCSVCICAKKYLWAFIYVNCQLVIYLHNRVLWIPQIYTVATYRRNHVHLQEYGHMAPELHGACLLKCFENGI
jgi:hypothetical protein